LLSFKFQLVEEIEHVFLTRSQARDKYGFINKKGEVIIPIKFDKAHYYFTNDVVELELDEKKYYYNKTEKEIKAQQQQ